MNYAVASFLGLIAVSAGATGYLLGLSPGSAAISGLAAVVTFMVLVFAYFGTFSRALAEQSDSDDARAFAGLDEDEEDDEGEAEAEEAHRQKLIVQAKLLELDMDIDIEDIGHSIITHVSESAGRTFEDKPVRDFVVVNGKYVFEYEGVSPKNGDTFTYVPKIDELLTDGGTVYKYAYRFDEPLASVEGKVLVLDFHPDDTDDYFDALEDDDAAGQDPRQLSFDFSKQELS